VTQLRGTDGRDALWAHPDLLPTSEDLENPDDFLSGDFAITDQDIANLEDGGGRPGKGEPGKGEPDKPAGED